MSSLNTILLATVVIFSLFTLLLFVAHEREAILHAADQSAYYLKKVRPPFMTINRTQLVRTGHNYSLDSLLHRVSAHDPNARPGPDVIGPQPHNNDHSPKALHEEENVGTLMCDGKDTKSEVIYWKVVPGDNEFESPITPHHGIHHDRYLTFEYDNGGWNNIRMSLECLIVSAHAMGRTVVLPPSQHLYLLTRKHKDKGEDKVNHEMGFEDFFDLDLLKSHEGLHVITRKEFLEKEALTGGLHGKLPPKGSSDIWGPPLWKYLEDVADIKPVWGGRFIAFPDRPGDFNFSTAHHPKVKERMKRFAGDRWSRKPIFYDEELQSAHHVHFPGRDKFRVLQHHYGMIF